MAKKAKKTTVVDDLTQAFEDVADQAEKALNKGWDTAVGALPTQAEKLVKDWTKQTRKLSKDLDKQRKQVVKQVEKTIADLDKQRARLNKQAEKQLDGIVDAFERNVTGAVRPVAKRLDIASQSEVATLKRRLGQLEKKVGVKKASKRGTAKQTRKAA